jgi:hypothetical protein
MSGLYNVLFGVNILAHRLLELLKLDHRDIPRFRDCYLQGGHIVVYTRTGGGNREDYLTEVGVLTSHPLYVRDEDDSYDETYASYFFKYPEEWRETLEGLAANFEVLPSKERWERAMAALKESG